MNERYLREASVVKWWDFCGRNGRNGVFAIHTARQAPPYELIRAFWQMTPIQHLKATCEMVVWCSSMVVEH
jgi:hypothetical protein